MLLGSPFEIQEFSLPWAPFSPIGGCLAVVVIIFSISLYMYICTYMPLEKTARDCGNALPWDQECTPSWTPWPTGCGRPAAEVREGKKEGTWFQIDRKRWTTEQRSLNASALGIGTSASPALLVRPLQHGPFWQQPSDAIIVSLDWLFPILRRGRLKFLKSYKSSPQESDGKSSFVGRFFHRLLIRGHIFP